MARKWTESGAAPRPCTRLLQVLGYTFSGKQQHNRAELRCGERLTKAPEGREKALDTTCTSSTSSTAKTPRLRRPAPSCLHSTAKAGKWLVENSTFVAFRRREGGGGGGG